MQIQANYKELLTLDKVATKRVTRISSINSKDRGLISRLCSLGIITGAKVEVLRVQPFGGPLSVKVLGSVFSLRQTEANQISVEALA